MRKLIRFLAVITLLVSAGPIALAGDTKNKLIPRNTLFGNPDRAQLRISHDGKHLAWTAPVEGVMNVWVAPADNLAAAKPVTRDSKRGIMMYRWAYTNQHILYSQDEGGNENYNVHAADITTGKTRNLTPNPKVNARVLEQSPNFPEEVIISINDRDPKFHDLQRVNILSGESKLLMANPGTIEGNAVAGLVPDQNFDVRLAVTFTADGGQEIFQPDPQPEKHDELGGWVSFMKIPFEDEASTDLKGFDASGNLLFMVDARDRDTAAMVELNLKTGDARVLAEDPSADAGSMPLVHPSKQTIQAVSFNFTRPQWKVVDPDIAPDVEYLRTVTDGDITISARTLDDSKWTVVYLMDDGPARYYLYDRAAKQAKFLFTNRDALEVLTLAKMHPIVVTSRDGLKLVCYLTVPPSADSDGDGNPDQPVPMVLLVHGGPWARDIWGYNPLHQWLANRGYAVLSVNYRGSTGFGKKFVNAANKEWAGKMHDDLLDAVDWAVKNGVAQKDKIAIMGASYGGYATLVGLTFTPDVFACGVDMVGPSNIRTLLETIPPYWAPMVAYWKNRVGDHTSAEGREFLDSRSPLSKVQNIKKPLLIGQGANDPRVKQSESDQIVSAMQAKNIPVTYLLYADEGHNFARPESRISFYAVTEQFLAQHLGGACQPIGDDLKGANLSVPAGADQIPGLEAAGK